MWGGKKGLFLDRGLETSIFSHHQPPQHYG